MLNAPTKIKKSKIKQRRRRIALLIIILLIVFICYLVFHARDYEKNYSVNDFEVLEKFDKHQKVYLFEIKKEDKSWHFMVEHKYLTKRKLITEIDLIDQDDTICIIPKSEQLSTYPQCIKDSEEISYHLVSNEMKAKLGDSYFQVKKSETKTYEKVDIKNIDENDYYIWNYKGFYHINKDKQENINLFSKDIYDISNVITINNLLVIPDYNQSYYFNKFYLLQMESGKTSTWEFKDSLYFDGYYLGSHNKSIYYIDRKNKLEWEILPSRKKMRKIGTESKDGKVFINGDWEKVSLTKLTNENLKFTTEEMYHYEIDHGLYVSYLGNSTRKKISNKEIKEIVATLDNKVYYISGCSLYYYTETTGEVELMTFFEWNFNYKNMIFILKRK